MLIELRVRDYAVIDQVTIRLLPGLNALTGETGAGKSILVGALSLLLGERASAEAVRPGASRTTVEGVFSTTADARLQGALDELGIDAEDGVLILKREMSAEGRSRAWINSAPVTAATLGRIGRLLIDLHGQHEHEALLGMEEQRAILDAFAGALELSANVAAAHREVREGEERLAQLESRRGEVAQRAGLLRHQVQEIETAKLRAGEEAELAAEATRLDHAEDLSRLSSQLYDALYAEETSVSARLDELRRTLSHLMRIDPNASEWQPVLEEAFHGLQELGRRMGEYASHIENNPARLDQIRKRQDLFFRLKARYGPDLADVLETLQRTRTELELLDTAQYDRAALSKELETRRAVHVRLCDELSDRRRSAARTLARDVNALLPDLGMPGGKFAVDLAALEATGSHGAESIEFRISVNAGFEPRALARVASGGELSRVMLALKCILARVDRAPALVFDEVDVGIGGRVAHRVAETLRVVAAAHQVLVVTHLPQIASRADHHLLVEKMDTAERATTVVHELAGDARVRELARLLGGDPESLTSLQHARELLTLASG